ncbi:MULTISPECIES: hypothetical protein [Acinetobacter]|uniref:hypothetical protein n=1 Tax=Acinetobacter TaxID=469 RepID=UPI00158BFAF0|nr:MULTISPECIES: hypothetical protein [Acinetobacter]MCU4629405.1 hypothetical protein [Acinetobacter variabilis]QKW83557.1 hypothetical protein FOC32_15340 [Acinetobacter sp. FDAARGOS_724]
MPQLLKHIDAIAREKDRDVLFVHFENYEHENADAESYHLRQNLMEWLKQRQINFAPCMGIEQPGVIESYSGDLYIDVPFDEAHPIYQMVSEHLEDAEEEMKIPGVLFFVLSLETALEIEADREEFLSLNHDEDEFSGRLN